MTRLTVILAVLAVLLVVSGCGGGAKSGMGRVYSEPVLRPEDPEPTTVPVSGEVYISGVSKSELRWAVTNELRSMGFTVVTRKGDAQLQIKMKKEGNVYLCTAILTDQKQVVAQGWGEASYRDSSVSSRRSRNRQVQLRSEAEVRAAVMAVRGLQ
jgi:hypothetical protein